MNTNRQMESLRRFYSMPRPKADYDGIAWILEVPAARIYRVAWGSGDNLDENEINNGYDDYLMVDQWRILPGADLTRIVDEIREWGPADASGMDEVDEFDGGQWLIVRNEWENGDIRRFILDACQFAGYNGNGKGLVGIHMEV